MSAVKLAIAGAAIYTGGASLMAGASGWAALSAGAMIAGGAATALGTARGDKEGEKWSEMGGYLMLAGSLGSMAADKMATKGADAAATKVADAATPAPVQSAAPTAIAQPPQTANFAADMAKSNSSMTQAPWSAAPAQSNLATTDQMISGIGTRTVLPAAQPTSTGLIGWMKDNPTAAMVTGQAVSGLASGLATSDAAAQAAEQARLEREAQLLWRHQTQYV